MCLIFLEQFLRNNGTFLRILWRMIYVKEIYLGFQIMSPWSWTKNPFTSCLIISCYFFFIWLKILLFRVNLRWLGFTDVMIHFFVAWLLTDYYISRFVMSSFAVSFVVMSTICPDNVDSYITSTNLPFTLKIASFLRRSHESLYGSSSWPCRTTWWESTFISERNYT